MKKYTACNDLTHWFKILHLLTIGWQQQKHFIFTFQLAKLVYIFSDDRKIQVVLIFWVKSQIVTSAASTR